MKMSVEDLKEIITILEDVESFRPLVKVIIDTLKSFSGELKDIPESIRKWTVENRIESIKQYITANFTREEAILMTLDDMKVFKNSCDRFSNNLQK